MQYISHSVSDTESFGRQLAQRLPPNTVVACRGGLGMGKTALTRGIAQGLGYTGRVTSPTFTIVNEYLGETPLFHFDMYRLEDSDALFDIGWEDYLERGGVCAVEWSENVPEAMAGALTVNIEKLGDTDRKITIEGGDGYEDLSL